LPPSRKELFKESFGFQQDVEAAMKRPRTSLDLETAETIAIAGLAFLAEDTLRLGRFLAETGVGPEELRENARAPRMLLAVVEHLLGDESLLLVFTASAGIAPESVLPAYDLLALEAARRERA
jgi:hypothetical protein